MWGKQIGFCNVLHDLIGVIGFLFVVELILGFNGTLLIVAGIGIRKLLFVGLVILCSIYILVVIRKYGLKEIFKLVQPFDYVLTLFMLLQCVWIIIIPFVLGEELRLAVKEALSLSTLILYFPLALMIKLNDFSWERIRKWIAGATINLALIHIIFYIGETLVGDATFVLAFFGGINQLTLGYSKRPLIMMPANYIRIIYPVSIFLLVPIYYIMTKAKWKWTTFIYYAATLIGLMTTITKSLFLGCIGGTIFYLVGLFCHSYQSTKKRFLMKYSKLILVTLVIVMSFDVFCCDRYVYRRVCTTFLIKAPQEQQLIREEIQIPVTTADKDQDEREGTERSNYTRIEQTRQLLNHWKERPLLGFGFGSYVPDYLRAGSETPYSYEMFLPAMLMKLGIVGLSIWIAFFLYLIGCIVKRVRIYGQRALAIGYLLIAVAIATQFNPFLLNSSGMAIILFVLLELRLMNGLPD